MNYLKQFRVAPGSKVDLSKVDAGFKGTHESHEHALPEIEAYTRCSSACRGATPRARTAPSTMCWEP